MVSGDAGSDNVGGRNVRNAAFVKLADTLIDDYDIEFTAAKFGENKKKTEPVHMTVHHNGVKIHDDVAITTDNTTLITLSIATNPSSTGLIQPTRSPSYPRAAR